MTRRGFIADGLGRVDFSPCSVYLTGRQIVQICVGFRSRANGKTTVSRKGWERTRLYEHFARLSLYAFDACFAWKADDYNARFSVTSVSWSNLASYAKVSWLRERIAVSPWWKGKETSSHTLPRSGSRLNVVSCVCILGITLTMTMPVRRPLLKICVQCATQLWNVIKRRDSVAKTGETSWRMTKINEAYERRERVLAAPRRSGHAAASLVVVGIFAW